MWLGPTPRVFILDPDKFKEMATKVYDFQKPDTSPLFKLLASGFANYDGDKWAKHRKIVSPAFNVEKMKVSLSFVSHSLSLHYRCIIFKNSDYFFMSDVNAFNMVFMKIATALGTDILPELR